MKSEPHHSTQRRCAAKAFVVALAAMFAGACHGYIHETSGREPSGMPEGDGGNAPPRDGASSGEPGASASPPTGSPTSAPTTSPAGPPVEDDTARRLYDWLVRQQRPSGLLPTAEDDRASTYCNALAALALTLRGDFQHARAILAAYHARLTTEFSVGGQPRGFYQYRSATTGEAKTDSDRWMGDNAWLLIAIHYYAERSKSTEFDDMATALVGLLTSLQTNTAGGTYVASGWHGDGTVIADAGHTEGNLDAQAALRLYGKLPLADAIAGWLTQGSHDWHKGPLDIHSWRVLSLGNSHGFCLQDVERTDRDDLHYLSTVQVNGKTVTGFSPCSIANCKGVRDVWSEGTGGMAVAYYAAGFRTRGDFYTGQLDAMTFEPVGYPGSLTVSFFPVASVDASYTWVDPSRGYVAGVTWHLFAKARFNPFTHALVQQHGLATPVQHLEAEDRESTENRDSCFLRIVQGNGMYGGKAGHFAGDANTGACSGAADYTFNVVTPVTNASISLRYADTMGGDGYEFTVDGSVVGSGTTVTTGTEQDFTTSKVISVGNLGPGIHTLRVRITDAKTNGVTIDAFDIGGTG
jgi:hypothetical protein